MRLSCGLSAMWFASQSQIKWQKRRNTQFTIIKISNHPKRYIISIFMMCVAREKTSSSSDSDFRLENHHRWCDVCECFYKFFDQKYHFAQWLSEPIIHNVICKIVSGEREKEEYKKQRISSISTESNCNLCTNTERKQVLIADCHRRLGIIYSIFLLVAGLESVLMCCCVCVCVCWCRKREKFN